MATSKRLYIYLQRPDDGRWVTVGRYSSDKAAQTGTFHYAPSYLDSGATWGIDPVNLPLSSLGFSATRYSGLHDVLRDTCPDTWGQALIRRNYQLPEAAPPLAYLLHAGNADRWGALAVGVSVKPNVGHLSSPKLAQVGALADELLAMFSHRPAVHPNLRKRLLSTPSLGGARPKATVHDGSDFWLVKPRLPSDIYDVPRLEHATAQWARAAGLHFSPTRYWAPEDGYIGALMSHRFDRDTVTGRRIMTVSAASLLQTEYPADAGSANWSYPALALVLGQVGAPNQDRKELFSRMIFNAVVGNDDDHPRNTAIVYSQQDATWRLAPAFDVVPNLDFQPNRLAMQVCAGHFDISAENVLADFAAFGFKDAAQVRGYLQDLLAAINTGFEQVAELFDAQVRDVLFKRCRAMGGSFATRHRHLVNESDP